MYDKEPKLAWKCSAVNWGAGDDFSTGYHQRSISKGWQGLLKAELSEMHQYSLGAVCLLSIARSRLQESAPQTGYDLPLKSAAAITSRQGQNKQHSSGNVATSSECWPF